MSKALSVGWTWVRRMENPLVLSEPLLRCPATEALRERERPGLREADGDLLVLSEPLLRCPTTEGLRGTEVLLMRSSGPTD